MARLSSDQIDSRLRSLPGWKREADFIAKSFEFETFMDGITFVNKIASIAERVDHHPDIHIRWTSVRLQIQTHDQGGVTPLDIELAEKIEKSLLKGPHRK